MNWISIKKEGYPILTPEESRLNYPQRLVLACTHSGDIKLLCWNFTEQCWDDEYGDDFMYYKEDVEYYMNIPEIPESDS